MFKKISHKEENKYTLNCLTKKKSWRKRKKKKKEKKTVGCGGLKKKQNESKVKLRVT